MIKKRAQVTIFIIIAIILVAGISLFFLVKNNSPPAIENIRSNIQPAYLVIQSCLKETGENALYKLGENGGVIWPLKTLSSGETYYTSDDRFSTLGELEGSISMYVNENMNACLEKYSLNLSGFKINNKNFTIQTQIKQGSILFGYSRGYILIERQETIYELKNFDVSFETDFLNIYNLSLELKERYFRNNGTDLTYLSSLENNDIQIFFDEYPSYTLITLLHNKGVENNLPYLFKFALK